MRKLMTLLIAITVVVSVAVSPVFAGGGKVQGDNSTQGNEQGVLGNGESPGDDKMGNQV
ncbi:MAG: hypothetical protein ACR2PB_04600 [Desulfocapsaceae bacterium]